MAVVAVVDVGDAGEPRGETLAHLLTSLEPPTPRLGPARQLENAVVGEEAHDRVEVVRVEGVEHLLERRGRHVVRLRRHSRTSVADSPLSQDAYRSETVYQVSET